MATADKPEPASDNASAAEHAPNSTPDDDLRRRFREALAHKQAGGPHGAAGHPGGKSAAPQSNAKRQRTFRRKSG